MIREIAHSVRVKDGGEMEHFSDRKAHDRTALFKPMVKWRNENGRTFAACIPNEKQSRIHQTSRAGVQMKETNGSCQYI